MSPPITAKVDRQALERIAKMIESQPARVAKGAKPMLQRWGQEWHGKMLDRFRGGDALSTRTGGLKRSLKHAVTGSGLSDLKLSMVAAGVNYARIQEFGGVIKPKTGRFLAIPTEQNKTSAGVPRIPSPRALIEANPGRTFFHRNEGGDGALTLFLILDKGQKGAIAKGRLSGALGGHKASFVPMFTLVRQVEIPGPKAPNKTRPSRLAFFDTWRSLAPSRAASLKKLAESLNQGVG